MKAVDFVVRDQAGALQRGVVPAGGAETVVSLTSGMEVSFNLRQADLTGQRREGDDLVLSLTDGREVRLENYFNDVGDVNRLFISADGYLNEVAFVEDTDGALFAQYGPTEQWGKWSPSDDLIYLGGAQVAEADSGEEVSMLGPALLGGLGAASAAGAAAVGGAALLGGLSGTDSGASATAAAPTVNDAEESFGIGGDDPADHVFEVSGTGQPDGTAVVTVGDQEVEAVIGPDGTWSVTFEDESFPDDGVYESVVVVTGPDGSEETLDGPGFVIDTTPPEVEILVGTGSVGDLHNAEGMADGVTISGIGEAGAALMVTVGEKSQSATIAEDGTWSVSWDAGVFDEGEYTGDVSVVATDAFGNSTTLVDTFVVDTVATVSIDGGVEGDDIVNADEASDGVTFTGQAQAGSTVVLTFAGAAATVIAAGDGAWSATFPASDIPSGESEVTLTAEATDTAGNSSVATTIVNVDTLVNALNYTSTAGGADGVINADEAANGLVVTGVVEPGSTLVVELQGVVKTATVAADGTWSATFAPGDLQAGTYSAVMVATAMDAAGNTASVSQTVTVDTENNTLTIDGPVEGDDIVNEAEASDGVILTGTADPGASVAVTLAGVTAQTVADGSGAWQAFFCLLYTSPSPRDA